MVFSWDDFVAGCLGGTAGLIVGHPADTIKLRQQTLNTTIINTILQTYRNEGIRGFFKGMLFPLLGTGPLNAIFFGVYSNSLRWFNQNDKYERVTTENPHWRTHVFLSGCIGGFSTLVINCPIEMVKTVLQSRTEGRKGAWKEHYVAPYEGMWSCVKGIYRERGITGFYKGGVPLMCRDVPSFGIYTLSYEVTGHWEPLQKLSETTRCVLAGGVAGVMAWVTVMPADFVKSRMQADHPQNPKYRGMLDCMVKTYRGEGVKVFFSGTVMIVLRAFPVNVAVFLVYEKSLNLLQYLARRRRVVSWAAIMPLDVVKARIQSDDPLRPQYRGMFDCFRKSYRQDGWKVFSKGFAVVALRAFPVNGAILLTYEQSLKLIRGLSLVENFE